MKIKQAIEISTKAAFIKRTVGYKKRHKENDAEHAYQLAIVSWTANHQYNLRLSDEKIIKLALVHDLVEIFAGDVDSHSNKKKNALKKKNEELAFKQLKISFFKLKEIHKEIEEYEKKESDESKLVNIIDKIIPERHVYYNNTDYYKKRKVRFEDWKDWLYRKVNYENLSKNLRIVVDGHVKEVAKTHRNLFYLEK